MRGEARKINRRTKPQGWLRRAAATVEMAIVSPLLLGLLFGIIEYGWIFMLQSNLTNAVRDACRVGIVNSATNADITGRFASAVSGTGLTTSSYTLSIVRSTTASNMTMLTVTARVPWSKASLVGGGILPDPKKIVGLLAPSSSSSRSSDMVASCSMMVEGT